MDLILENSKSIDTIKEGLQKNLLYFPDKHDDLWILRFIFSCKKKVKLALKASKTVLQLRQDYKLDEIDIRQHPATIKLNHTVTQKCLARCREGAMSIAICLIHNEEW